MNRYKVFVTENIYFELKASFFYIEENTVVFINRKEINVDKHEDKKVAIVPLNSLYMVVDTEFQIKE
jgi:hypothetical protein